MRIEREANKCLKHAEEGMILTVTVNAKRAAYDMTCDYPKEIN